MMKQSDLWFYLAWGLLVLVLVAFYQANLFKPIWVLPDNYYCFHTATPYQQSNCQHQLRRLYG